MTQTLIHHVFCRRNWITVLIVGSVPPLVFLISDLVLGTGFAADLPVRLLYSIVFSYIITLLLFFGTATIIQVLQQVVPWQHHPIRRLVVEAVSVLAYACVMMYLATVIFHRYFIPEVDFSSLLFSNMLLAVTLTIMVVTIEEGGFFLRQWKESLIHSEKLKKERAESQYEALRNQVNPHFLFNSLNSLTALVHKDPDKAVKFISEFSRIYRYVLEVNNKVVVELSKELDFLQSYFFLQQIRFGENLKVEINVPGDRLPQLVPPLSLQLLAENAIKHNEISAMHPLHIFITLENDQLVMKNNLRPRDEPVYSTGIGLQNLRSRYEAISEKLPEFYASGNFYVAKIPILLSD
jgi:hypothetical protein